MNTDSAITRNNDRRCEEEDVADEVAIQEALERLDDEYDALRTQESQLIRMLEKLKKEEGCIRRAIQEAEATPQQKKRKQNEHRVSHLEAALLEAAAADSSSSDDD